MLISKQNLTLVVAIPPKSLQQPSHCPWLESARQSAMSDGVGVDPLRVVLDELRLPPIRSSAFSALARLTVCWGDDVVTLTP